MYVSHPRLTHIPLKLRRQVKIIRVLGEGGFSFVYLAQDEASGVCSHCIFSFHVLACSHAHSVNLP